jgi:DNA-binding LytR/AlgR family response regulator
MNNKPFITLPTLRGAKLINVNKVEYIYSDGKNSIFYFEDDEQKTVSCCISSVEKILETDNMPFVRCNQHCLVNIFKVDEIFSGSNGLALTNEKEFKITRTYKENFRQVMKKYCCRIANGL